MSFWSRTWIVVVHYFWQTQFVDYPHMMADVAKHYYDTEEQKLERIRKLLRRPLHEIARHCDWMCFWALVNLDYELLRDDYSSDAFPSWNITSVGNAASVALHAEDPEIRKACLDVLGRYKQYIH